MPGGVVWQRDVVCAVRGGVVFSCWGECVHIVWEWDVFSYNQLNNLPQLLHINCTRDHSLRRAVCAGPVCERERVLGVPGRVVFQCFRGDCVFELFSWSNICA